MRKASLTAREQLELGEAHLALGDGSPAETAFFSAMSKGGLSPNETYRVQFGLGQASELLGQFYSAKSHYSDAWRSGQTDSERDTALIELAQVEMRIGDSNAAREHTRAIRDRSRPEVQELDHLLGTSHPTAARSTPSAAPPASAGARPSGRGLTPPPLHPRAEWRARPVSTQRDTDPMGRPTRITLHHTADLKPVGSSLAENAERIRAYQTAHQQTEGWADIGYHFVVDRQGRVWEGRSLTLKGAHAGNKAANEHNIGIALTGNFDATTPTPAQMTAVTTLVMWLCNEYGIPSAQIFTHHQMEQMYHIKGTTRCPGKRFDAYLEQIKRAVQRGGR